MTTASADGVTTVTIVNPAKRNAIDDATRHALLAELRDAIADHGCRAIVLAGAPGAFCAGGELSTMPTDEEHIRIRMGEMQQIARLLHTGPKPVVAAVDGPAIGSGLALAMACDRVIATPRARFGCTFGRVGLVPDVGAVWTLGRRMRAGAARDLLLRSRILDLDEAYAVGLVDEIATEDAVLDRARAWAGSFGEVAPQAVAAVKRLLASEAATFEALLAAELDAQVERLGSAEFAEGREAFFERRPPRF